MPYNSPYTLYTRKSLRQFPRIFFTAICRRHLRRLGLRLALDRHLPFAHSRRIAVPFHIFMHDILYKRPCGNFPAFLASIWLVSLFSYYPSFCRPFLLRRSIFSPRTPCAPAFSRVAAIRCKHSHCLARRAAHFRRSACTPLFITSLRSHGQYMNGRFARRQSTSRRSPAVARRYAAKTCAASSVLLL